MFKVRKSDKKGSLILEAAIFLPIFILSMLILILIIRMIATEENIMRIFVSESQSIAKQAYTTSINKLHQDPKFKNTERAAIKSLLYFKTKVKIAEEHEPVGQLRLDNFDYLFEEDGLTGLIRARLIYTIDVPLPLVGRRTMYWESLLCRGFIGSDSNESPMDFSIMETEDDSVIVYVFPRAGEKFHARECRIIVNHPEEVLLSPALRKSFSPCQLCEAETISYGAKVYCFMKSGRVYHRKNCNTVERYVIPLIYEEAIEQGYTPCSICGGFCFE